MIDITRKQPHLSQDADSGTGGAFSVRVRLASWCVVAGIMVALLGANLLSRNSPFSPDDHSYGWPVWCCTYYVSPDSNLSRFDCNPSGVAVNLAVAVVIIGCTYHVSNQFRAATRRGQVPLRTLLMLVAVMSAISALLAYELSPFFVLVSSISPTHYSYQAITLHPVWIYIPVLIGVACVAWTACQIISMTGRWLRTAWASRQ